MCWDVLGVFPGEVSPANFHDSNLRIGEKSELLLYTSVVSSPIGEAGAAEPDMACNSYSRIAAFRTNKRVSTH
jgi:hypothetical protein